MQSKYVLMVWCCCALFALFALSACGSGRSTTPGVACPWSEKNQPRALLVAADDLLAFQAVMKRAPKNLEELDQTNMSSNGAYAQTSYAYHPNGIGVLSEGWRVMLTDDRIRKPGFIWCVVRPPSRSAQFGALRVVLVPLAEAREAAAMAGHGAASDKPAVIP